MIAGGSEAAVTPFGYAGFCSMKAMATKFNDQPSKVRHVGNPLGGGKQQACPKRESGIVACGLGSPLVSLLVGVMGSTGQPSLRQGPLWVRDGGGRGGAGAGEPRACTEARRTDLLRARRVRHTHRSVLNSRHGHLRVSIMGNEPIAPSEAGYFCACGFDLACVGVCPRLTVVLQVRCELRRPPHHHARA